MEEPVERAINLIRKRFDEPLSLADLAEVALLSPFHFSRLFRRATGVSPGRFLAAVRMYEAKRLLLTTSLSVAEVSCRVGYSSVSTFTTRFTQAVGVSPARYRRLPRQNVLAVADTFTRMPDGAACSIPSAPTINRPGSACIAGSVRVADGRVAGRTIIALFGDPIPQRPPEACLTLPRPGEWRLDGAPEGTWIVMAIAQPVRGRLTGPGRAEQEMLVGSVGPLVLGRGMSTHVDLRVRPSLPTDPPILLTLNVAHAA